VHAFVDGTPRLVLGVALLYGERPASMNDFDNAVAAGRVHEVSLAGDLPVGASGSTTVELHWREGLIARVSQVRQVSPDVQPSAASTGTDRTVVGDLVAHLTTTHPGLLVISRAAPGSRPGPDAARDR